MEGIPIGETIHIIAKGIPNFMITLDMLYIDEGATQKPLKEIKTLDLALPKIPTKALYQLQINVAQKIQSRARLDVTNLQTTQEEKITPREAIIQEGKEKQLVQQKVEEIEKHIGIVFQTILDNAGLEEVSSEENMKKIAQALEQYKSQIKELEECAVPTTPLEVRVQ